MKAYRMVSLIMHSDSLNVFYAETPSSALRAVEKGIGKTGLSLCAAINSDRDDEFFVMDAVSGKMYGLMRELSLGKGDSLPKEVSPLISSSDLSCSAEGQCESCQL